MTVTFFGHRNTPQSVRCVLQRVLTDLIENHNADIFYSGNQGGFDDMVGETLKMLKNIYPNISYTVVLAYMPGARGEYDGADRYDTVYPSGLEGTPRRYAIYRRNKWMLEQADTVVTYVRRPAGGASRFKELAERKGKYVINLPDCEKLPEQL